MSTMLPLSGFTSELLKLVAKLEKGLLCNHPAWPCCTDSNIKLVWFLTFAYLSVNMCVLCFLTVFQKGLILPLKRCNPIDNSEHVFVFWFGPAIANSLNTLCWFFSFTELIILQLSCIAVHCLQPLNIITMHAGSTVTKEQMRMMIYNGLESEYEGCSVIMFFWLLFLMYFVLLQVEKGAISLMYPPTF